MSDAAGVHIGSPSTSWQLPYPLADVGVDRCFVVDAPYGLTQQVSHRQHLVPAAEKAQPRFSASATPWFRLSSASATHISAVAT